MHKLFVFLAGAVALAQDAPDHPSVIAEGKTFTPRSILARNMGMPEDQITAFPPHKIVGNIYYVGTRTLSSFLIVTAQGNILIDSTYERNVRTIEKSVEQLGFKFSDIRILLGNHAHGDHMEGDALVKELTGAQVVSMAEDVPALKAMKPGGKEHPVEYAKIKPGGLNPFVDPSGCRLEADMEEAMFKAILAEQEKAEQQH